MQVLVTGGAGFIGSNYVEHLLGSGEDVSVTTLDALTYAGEKSNLSGVLTDPRHEFVEGNVCDRDLVERLVEGTDVIVNFAAESHVDRSIWGASTFVTTNVGGTQTLLEAARERGVDRFVQISTDEVYGEILEGRFAETDRLQPRNPYAATKAGADLLARSYHTTHDVPVVIVRASNNYGPRQHPEKFIPKMINNALDGRSLPIYGDGSNVREWLYVTDTCRAIETVRRQGDVGEVYNVGSGEEYTNLEVARAIVKRTGASEELLEFVDDRAGHDQRYALDTAKIYRLGWEPKVSFDEGLDRTIAFYSDDGPRPS